MTREVQEELSPLDQPFTKPTPRWQRFTMQADHGVLDLGARLTVRTLGWATHRESPEVARGVIHDGWLAATRPFRDAVFERQGPAQERWTRAHPVTRSRGPRRCYQLREDIPSIVFADWNRGVELRYERASRAIRSTAVAPWRDMGLLAFDRASRTPVFRSRRPSLPPHL